MWGVFCSNYILVQLYIGLLLELHFKNIGLTRWNPDKSWFKLDKSRFEFIKLQLIFRFHVNKTDERDKRQVIIKSYTINTNALLIKVLITFMFGKNLSETITLSETTLSFFLIDMQMPDNIKSRVLWHNDHKQNGKFYCKKATNFGKWRWF